MSLPWKRRMVALAVRQRRTLRESEAAFVVVAAVVGIGAGVMTNFQGLLAHAMQGFLYGVDANRLSALGAIHHPWRLLALPFGGLLLVGLAYLLRRRARTPIDVVEANALHGGRVPFTDSMVVAAQTIVSNGSGASVGLEAAYAQVGGGLASILGQWFRLRRNDLRTLVGAGAGAAVGAAFGAPLTGAFYAFEIVIGNYTPSAIAPVIAATLSAASVTRLLGVEPYLLATTSDRTFTTADYGAYAVLGLLCAALGILIMRLVTSTELLVQSWGRLGRWRPFLGGCLLIPIAWLSPQALSAGHGALHLDLALRPTMLFLVVVLVLKIAASVVSLSFGFRGGLFFASLFLGSLLGQLFAGLLNAFPIGLHLDPNDAALVGMAALSVAVVGGPMTLAMLMLETTHDFRLMGVVLTATLVSSTCTREWFGYSFSTWRLHLRGSMLRSPRDIGRTVTLTARKMMRADWVSVAPDMRVAAFRAAIPLGSASKAILVDAQGRYCGIIPTAAAYRPDLDPADRIAPLAILGDVGLSQETGVRDTLKAFDNAAADELAVVDSAGNLIGIVTEKHARRRYAEEIEATQREMFGEA